ncbi:carbohydrate ABC transporter permease [Niallia circulans]|jgi:putative aldouronate transport system permease protein|uniref:ABC transporter permease n=1 Tax=Niallia circulans TaxID=1397 RepID=A0A0J1INL2_NIACI|nr:carbohydrate ABC transporter permease [Niallia circulans]KLV27569.1 ABC transporter permease [Niallia circulans]MCM2981237.1 carbohydrate ABC transporter permease [Niallia circulans]MDR4316785.1 carbohydrate ABC transporter permease [Niallia circulans]MED3840221.1 carbohydrate ABC transporter permease [Niallia circulans]MED4241909.1 carbohydrate ABC transporter permease [Niallia circulans]
MEKVYKNKKITKGGRVFSIINGTILIIIALICFLPFVNVIASSFASTQEVVAKRFILIPETFSLDAYRYILSTPTLFKSLAVSVGVTGVGTLVSMVLTSLMAYGLSRKYLNGRGFLNFLVVFSMLFSGGMIPTFLVVKAFGLIDSYWSLILPVAINAFNLIIMRNFFQALPDSLEESAKMDGCTDLGVFWKIMLPLALPSIATISLFYAVTYWNTYMTAILYINDSTKWPIQVLLRQIVIVSSGMQAEGSSVDVIPPAQTIKMAVIVIATVPMLIAYPFVQKYFVKGALVGSVKG